MPLAVPLANHPRPQKTIRWIVIGYLANLLLLGLAAFIGLYNVHVQDQSLHKTLETNREKARLMQTLYGVLRERMLLLHIAAEEEDPIEVDDLLARYRDYARTYISAREALGQTSLSPVQLEQLQRQSEALRQTQPVLDRIAELLLEGHMDKARAQLRRTQGVSNHIRDQLLQMAELERQTANQTELDGSEVLARARTQIALFIGISLLASGVILFFILRLIRQKNQATQRLLLQLDQANARLGRKVALRTAELEDLSWRNQQIVDAAMDGFYIANTQGRILDCNEVLERMLGYTKAELLQRYIWDVEATDSQVAVQERSQRILREGRDYFDSSIRCKDGRVLHVAVHVTLAKDDEDPLFFIYIHDISERKYQEAMLIASESRFRSLVEKVHDWIWTVDAEGRFTYSSPRVESLLGYPPQTIIGKSLIDFMPRREAVRARSRYGAILAKGKAFDGMENLVLHKDESELTLETSGMPLYNEQQELLGYTGVSRDISERKRTEQELRTMALVFESKEAIFITDAQSRFVRVNEAFTRITGYGADEVIGQGIGLMKSGRHDEAFYKSMWRDIELKDHWEGEIWNKRKNGEIYPEWLSITAVRDIEGAISNYIAHFTDLSLLKSQQTQLERVAREEQTLAKVLHLALNDSDMDSFLGAALQELIPSVSGLESLPRGIIFLAKDTPTGPCLEMRAQHNLTAITQNKCQEVAFGDCICGQVAKTKQPLLPGQHQAHGALSIANFPAHNHDHTHYVLPLLHGDDVLGALNLYVRTDYNPSATETEFLFRMAQVLSLGIHRRLAEQQLIEARIEAEEANQAKSRFLSQMSHELRTPLNAIIGFSQLLELAPLDPGDRDNVEEIHKAGKHLLNLINEVLDLARIESGRIDIHPEQLDLGALLQDCASLILPLAQQAKVQLELPKRSLRLLADRNRLKQVMLNLLSNAIKYNHPGGQVRVWLDDLSSNAYCISVEDTGIGLSLSQMEHLFEPFNRLHAEQGHIEGSGIGLIIVKNLIELMGWQLAIHSHHGLGSCFHILLRTPQRPHEIDRTAPIVPVLVLGDNPANLYSLADWLRCADLEPHITHLEAEAKEHIQAHRPRLAVLDEPQPWQLALLEHDMRVLALGETVAALPPGALRLKKPLEPSTFINAALSMVESTPSA
jgi:PAS domain S-box-containing protein